MKRTAVAGILAALMAVVCAAEEPTSDSQEQAEEPLLLIDNLGHIVVMPPTGVNKKLLPKTAEDLGNQIPTNPSGGGKLPERVQQRIEAAAAQAPFRWFPATPPRLGSYLAGNDQIGNTAIQPGPLVDLFPLEDVVQGAKYDLSQAGLRYSLRQTLNYSGSSQTQSGSEDLGFYTFYFFNKWAVFRTPATTGWLSAKILGKTGLGPAGQDQDAQKNLGTLTSPTAQWSSDNGFRIPELAWQESFHPGKFVAVAGVVDQANYLDGNLYANNARGQFMNSALVDTMVVPLPNYNFGVNLQWQPSEDWYGILGASAGNAVAGQTPWTDFNWENWSVVAEIGYAPDDFLGLGPGVYRVQPFAARNGGPTQGGVGFNFQQKLGATSPFGWFGRFGVGGSQGSAIASTQIGSGFVMIGPLADLGLVKRLTNDVFGVGFVWSQPAATTKTVYHRNEYVFEAFYTLQLAPTVRIQPDVQVVWNPVFSPDAGPSTIFQVQYILAW
jgi:hypothetical protein